MLIPRNPRILSMNLHPVRASLPFLPSDLPVEPTTQTLPTTSDFTSSTAPHPSTATTQSVTASSTEPWTFPANYLHISWQAAIALDIIVALLGISLIFVLSLYIRRSYRRRQLRSLVNMHNMRSDEDLSKAGIGNPSGNTSVIQRLRNSKSSMRKLIPGRGMRNENKKAKGHVRWESADTAWDEEVGRAFSSDEKRGSSSPSSGNDADGITVGTNAAAKNVIVIEGDERQMRANLRAVKGCDVFRGS